MLGTGMGWEDGRGRGRAERREERKEDMGVSEDRGIQTGLRCQQIRARLVIVLHSRVVIAVFFVICNL